ncbi:MAG: hypothetical protein JWM80_2144 [Cyanobacteria bacterium RYN_339]|nr:hypothetical protein [Cyanobacteria bacterium RYN_339]
MRRSLPPCLLVLALLSACQAGTRAAVTAARPSPPAKPTASATPAAPPRPLQKPPGDSRLLEGTVQLDAGYMASVAVGRPLAQAFAVAEAQLLSNNGGNIISDNGGGIISDNGGGILSNNGGGIVSNNGGALTSKVKFGLLADAPPALGQQLPIAGMALAVVGLGDRKPLPLGVDAAGKPAYVVYSDAQGHYKLFLTQDQTRNVEVVAAVPDNADPRLKYGLVVDLTVAGARSFNEESALASDYLRNAIYEMFATSFTSTTYGEGGNTAFDRIPAELRPLAEASMMSFVEDAEARKRLSVGRFRRAIRRVADALIARVDLASIQTFPFVTGEGKRELPAGPAIPALEALLKEVDEHAAARMAADPHFFDGKPYVTEANLRRAVLGLPAVGIKRPSDVGRFTNEEYAGTSAPGRANSSWAVLADIGLSNDKDTALRLTYQSVFVGVLQQIMTDEALHDELKKVENGIFEDELDPTRYPEPVLPTAAVAPFEIPAEPAVTVGTLVGSGTAGATDGPAATASVDHVTGLAITPANRLYFTQAGGKLRMIDLAAPGQPVTTIAGTGFTRTDTLLLDPAAAVTTFYVGDGGQHKLFKLELPDGLPPKVTAIAGSGVPGTEDGPGATATFVALNGLALDGQGGLIVADPTSNRVRRVDLVGAGHAVTTVVGAPRPDGLTPGGGTGALMEPVAALVLPTSELLVLEGTGSRLFKLGADGLPRLVAGMSGEHNAVDGFYLGAGFRYPHALAYDLDGSVLVGDAAGERVRRVRLRDGAGVVTTIAGSGKEEQPGYQDGLGTTARFAGPGAIAVGKDGTIYVGELNGTRIRTIK